LGEKRVQRGDRDRVLQRGHKDRQRVQPRPQQRFDQPVDRVQSCALHQSAVENQRYNGRAVGPAVLGGGQVRHARAGPIDACAEQRSRGHGLVGAVEHGLRVAQEVLGVLRPALDQIGPESVVVCVAYCRQAAQLRVGLVVAGQQGQRHARVVAMGGVLLGPVFPVARSAQHAGDDQFGLRRAGFDMQIHGHGVGQMGEVCQSQAWGR